MNRMPMVGCSILNSLCSMGTDIERDAQFMSNARQQHCSSKIIVLFGAKARNEIINAVCSLQCAHFSFHFISVRFIG